MERIKVDHKDTGAITLGQYAGAHHPALRNEPAEPESRSTQSEIPPICAMAADGDAGQVTAGVKVPCPRVARVLHCILD